MAHKLPRLSKSLLDKPQLIHPSKMEEITEVLSNRSEYLKANKELLSWYDDKEDELEVDNEYGDPDLGVLRVEGPTTYKLSGWEAFCGGCSYTNLIDQMKEFAEQGKKKVLMKVDSPGGQAFRMVFTSKELRRIADENDIKLVAYVDGMAASAGLGLACAAHEIVMNPDSDIGSCGVVISLFDDSKYEAEKGFRHIYITAGAKKRPFEEDGSFKEGFLQDLQEDVNTLYDKFATLVADMRGMTVESVKATEADMYRADEAIDIGFADKVMEEPEFLEYFLGKNPKDNVDDSEKRGCDPLSPTTSLITEKVKTNMSDIDNKVEMSVEMSTQLEAMKASMLAEMTEQFQAKEAALAAELNAYKAKEEEAAKEALSTKLESFAFASEQKEPLMSFFMEANDANKSLMNSVLESAQGAIADKEEALAQAEQAHTEELEAVKAEAANKVAKADEALEEFGTAEQTAVEAVPTVEAVDDAAARKARVAELKAEKEAKNK